MAKYTKDETIINHRHDGTMRANPGSTKNANASAYHNATPNRTRAFGDTISVPDK